MKMLVMVEKWMLENERKWVENQLKISGGNFFLSEIVWKNSHQKSIEKSNENHIQIIDQNFNVLDRK